MRNWARTTKVVTRLQTNDLINPVVCTGLDWEGYGVCQVAVRRTQQDFPVALARVLPEESVVLKVAKAERRDKFLRNAPYKASFQLHATNQSSPYEIPAKCPAFVKQCGGCTFQHLDYGKQVAEKQRLLDELFEDVEVDNVIPSPNWGYRSRMEFTFLRGSDGPTLAMQQARSIIPLQMTDCPLLPPKALQCMQALPKALQSLGIQPYDQRTARGILQRAVFKTGEQGDTERVLVHLHVETDDAEVQNRLALAIREIDVDQVVVEGPSESITIGDPIVHEIAWASGDTTRLVVAPKVFFQPNLRLLPKMIELTMEMAGPPGVVWDVFSGAGTLGIRLSQAGFHVHCVDMSLRGLQENAVLNNVNVTPHEMNLELRPDFDHLPKPDVIVVDPPRDGCPVKLRRWIKASDVPRIVYVSCNPRTLHRDALYLAEAGYRIQRVAPLDFYPHISHIELVALLTKE
eukprot:GEMP01025836.1.p1 GENE.GEMP01025836.1~~GEMP01025836.1.p1  ORF type:complete len:460 (+),score=112.52 GEMP01025836.1:143-1522(+)